MKKFQIKTIKIIGYIAILFFLTMPYNQLSLAQHDYVDITKPSLRKIPIAVPLFKTIPVGHPEMSKDGSDLLSESLDFTGYFKMLDRNTFRVDSQQMDITYSGGNFGDWTNIGAELLITAGIWVKENNLIETEFRLFDTFRNQLLVGKKYKGWKDDLPKMIRRFCNEVIYSLTGEWGIFDTQIAFVSSGSGNKEVYICDFDGQNPKPFTHDKSIALFPAWSSDGKWLAYTSYAKGNPDIFIRHISEKRGTVISNKGINTTPAWVPGKFMLAATLSFSGDQEIYLLTGQGKITKKLTTQWGIDVSPAWSPDGSRMAFVSDRSGNPQIYIKDMGSGQERRLTFQGKYNTQPSWSPRGNQIAFSSMEGSQINIYVANLDGGGVIRLTQNAGKNESPSWSPDSSMIVFSSTREGPSRIYVMTAYGTDQRRLLALRGQQATPRWSPRLMNN